MKLLWLGDGSSTCFNVSQAVAFRFMNNKSRDTFLFYEIYFSNYKAEIGLNLIIDKTKLETALDELIKMINGHLSRQVIAFLKEDKVREINLNVKHFIKQLDIGVEDVDIAVSISKSN